MKKSAKLILAIILLTLTATMIVALAGCSNGASGAEAAERIQVDDTHIYLAPSGAPSSYALKPLVYPVATASQKVYYKLADASDKKYLTISESGVLQARGELKLDDDGNPVDIIVRIISAATPSVTLNITVTIETVDVKKISFAEHTVVVELTSKGVQLEPIFYPYHAINGRNVIYTSQDDSIAKVDANGFVRPVGIGKVAIWVVTPKQGAFGQQVETHVIIDVRYSVLNYRLDLTTGASTLKQIYGQTENIGFVLNMLDLNCDPSPSIAWYVNNTPIDGAGVKDNRVLNYDPSKLPVGEYNIRAVLDNSTQRQELISDKIIVYKPVENITLDLLNAEGEYYENDTIKLLVTYPERVYPPESYTWTIEYTDTRGETHFDIINKAPAEQNGYLPVPDLAYKASEAGEYRIYAEAVVKGISSGVRSNVQLINVRKRAPGNDITDLYVDGVTIDNEVYPAIYWKPLPYETTYYVEVESGSEFISLSSDVNGGYFFQNGVYLPFSVKFENDFAVRVKSATFNNWTEWLTYEGGTIKQNAYSYFKEIAGGYNGYIADMRELGDLLNYIAVFRPTSPDIFIGDRYKLEVYIPFGYGDLPSRMYPAISEQDQANIDRLNYGTAEADTYKLVVTAKNTYVESMSMRCGVGNCISDGARVIYIDFNIQGGEGAPSRVFDENPVVKDGNSLTHYTTTPRAEDAELPIDALTATERVAKSNELFLAVMRGKRPVPVTNSAADRIYRKAREALCEINGENSTDRAKILAIYEWISANVVYDYKIASETLVAPYDYNSFYLEGVFDDGVAVCDGLAKAFSLMCAMEGIPTYRICGTNLSGVGHAWNAALVDGEYYVIDVTWSNNNPMGSNIELITYKNFCLGKAGASREHVQYGEYTIAEGKSFNYVYNIPIGGDYDTEVDSDEELIYLADTYLPSVSDTWVEIKLEDSYLLSKGGVTESIKQLLMDNLPDGYELTLMDETNTLLIKIHKII